MTTQQRVKPRLTLNACIPVRDTMHDRDLGELVNLTDEGLMIVSDSPICSDAIYQVKMMLPEAIDEQHALELGVECLWCRQTDNSERYWSGYQIIDASAQARQMLRTLWQPDQHQQNALTTG